VLGALADDFTGATDLALNLVASGWRTVVTTAIPARDARHRLARDADAVVIALKNRTSPPDEAVADARRALAALRELGAERIYDKYCSTFDSTPRGNIGPILDALAADLGADTTVVVPSFPAAGRTVYQGHLFVGDTLLSESSLRHHPLTPMTDPDVRRVLGAQSSARVGWLGLATVRRGAAALRAALDALPREPGEVLAVVVDAVDESDLRIIAEATSHLTLLTGGSGLALGLTGPSGSGTPATTVAAVPGHRVVLAGSASAATREQVARAREVLPHRKLDLGALRDDFDATVAELVAWSRSSWESSPVLIYAAGEPGDVSADRAASVRVERALAACATGLVDAGARQLVVAGGETSGAVVSALGVSALTIGQAVAPGVAWSRGESHGRPLNLLLKSGNFGGPDLMTHSWERLG
jgi:3-dehydrotetronate 4-kinase